MAAMYKFYQLVGGDEAWTPIQAQLPLDKIKPTFVTVLAVDTLIGKETSKEDINKAKYLGPLYFDIDAEDISEAIESGKELVAKLMEYELTEQDIQIFLSGKKGLHVIVPEACFQEKPLPMQGLVQVYKEMALRFAVHALDFRVYSARRGRQFRTCYNVRENGNYKVPVSLGELHSLTPESYSDLCKQPRSAPLYAPQWRPRFALAFDEAVQKVGKIKPRKVKAVTPAVLQDAMPVFSRLASGKAKADCGFNNLAMQLALYARECRWTEDAFIGACAGVIENHESDGSRYNSARKRDAELRRMFWYVEDNTNLDFGTGALKSCMGKDSGRASETGLPEAPTFEDFVNQPEQEEPTYDEQQYGGVYKAGSSYMVSKGEDGDQSISNFTLEDITILRNLKEESIYKVTGRMRSNLRNGLHNAEVSFGPTSLSSSSGVQNTFAKYGGSFLGNDTHARGLYNLMIRESKHNKFVITSEGVNCIRVRNPNDPNKDAPAQEYTVWADKDGVLCGNEIPFDLMFLGDPDPAGLAKTDMRSAPDFATYIENGEEERVFKCLENLFNSHTPETMGKMIGWAASCFYAPMFQIAQKKFPLMHVYGPAGSGKSLALNTPVIMADGSTKVVQDIKVGDFLLSPYGGKRLVTNTHSARERMWKVKQSGGANKLLSDFVCNESHILSLVDRNTLRVMNIEITEYEDNYKFFKATHCGWSVPGILQGDMTKVLHEVEVEPLEEGDYYGFTLDGDHLFMLGDFTVTHNTETIRGILRMFYHKAEAMETSPNSTLFSIQQQMASTASIPLFVDEYKPHEMDRLKLNQMRAVFRDAYNAKLITRGGGNRNNKDDYNALNSLKMEAPVIFAAEAPETETAIVERSVMVSFKRLSGRAQANAYRSALAFYTDEEPLSSLGLELAQIALQKSAAEAMEPFQKYLAWANSKYLPGPDDAKMVEEGKMTEEEMKLRASLRPRNVFAAAVSLFGMQMVRNCLIHHFGKDKVEERLGKQLKLLSTAVFIGMDSLSAATVPEFIKALGVMADMSKLPNTDAFALTEGVDYNLTEINGESTLVLATAQAYRKYRAYNKHTGSVALFPGEDAFKLALHEIPQFLKKGERTQRLIAQVVYLNLDELYRAGCPSWAGKPVVI